MPSYPNVGKDYLYTLESLKKIQFDFWVAAHAEVSFDCMINTNPVTPTIRRPSGTGKDFWLRSIRSIASTGSGRKTSSENRINGFRDRQDEKI